MWGKNENSHRPKDKPCGGHFKEDCFFWDSQAWDKRHQIAVKPQWKLTTAHSHITTGFPSDLPRSGGQRRERGQQSFLLQCVWNWSCGRLPDQAYRNTRKEGSPQTVCKRHRHNRPLQETSESARWPFAFSEMWINSFTVVNSSHWLQNYSHRSRKSKRPWGPSQLWKNWVISQSSR